MQIDINIEGIVAESVAAALAPEKLQPIIQSNLDKAVKDAIEDQFSYRSSFRELLKEKLASAMPTDIADIGRYGDLVLKTVNGILSDYQSQTVRQTIEERMRDMLKPLPERMKLSELVKRLTEKFESGNDHEGDDRPTFIVEKSSGITHEYWYLYADPRSDRSKYSCSIQMRFRDDGECWDLSISGEKPKERLYLGAHFGADALALNIYTGAVKIDFEHVDTDEIYYSHSED